ncbi:chemotaxis protein CheA [Thermodesulfobacteriota bacterium]
MDGNGLFEENKEMLEGFVADSQELLEEIEPKLIELQQSTDISGSADEDTLNAIFRLFHSLKGAASFLNLTAITGVTHEAETLLNHVREGRLELNAVHTDVLCRTCDFIHLLLSQIEEQGSDQGRDAEVQVLVDEIGAAGLSKPPSASPAEVPAAAVAFDDGGEATLPEEEIKITITAEMLQNFIQESDELIDGVEHALVDIDTASDKKERIDTAFRNVHSFKGNCGFLGFADLERLSHAIEEVLENVQDGKVELNDGNVNVLLPSVDTLRTGVADISQGGQGELKGCDVMVELLEGLRASQGAEPKKARLGEILVARGEASAEAVEEALGLQGKPLGEILVDMGAASSDAVNSALAEQAKQPGKKVMRKDIRVDLDKLDSMIDLVGELVIAQLMVTHNPDLRDHEFENFSKSAHHLERVTAELQDVAMSIRMVPLAATFRKMIRLVHDLSRKFNKKVNLELQGEETEVDKTVIEQISDPLVHIIRNAIDHGVEKAETRTQLGKNEVGTITLEAKHDGGEVVIVICDDGAGLNRDRILQKSIERGLVSGDASGMHDEDVFKLIFEPGFSTADKVTDVSGRGVGMDVVKKNIDKLKGNVDIKSTPGQGTTFVLRLPLTLAIIDGMLVRTGQSHYIIPLLAIRESFRPEPRHITTMPDGQEVVRVREEMLPIVRLHDLYQVRPDTTELHNGILAIVENQRDAVCLFLDEILGQQQTVIKGLPSYMSDIQGVSGCSILGDGQVCLILDVGSLIDKSKQMQASRDSAGQEAGLRETEARQTSQQAAEHGE